MGAVLKEDESFSGSLWSERETADNLDPAGRRSAGEEEEEAAEPSGSLRLALRSLRRTPPPCPLSPGESGADEVGTCARGASAVVAGAEESC